MLDTAQAPLDGGNTPGKDQADQIQQGTEHDFMADQQAFRMKFHTLTMVDVFSKEVLAMKWVSAREANMRSPR